MQRKKCLFWRNYEDGEEGELRGKIHDELHIGMEKMGKTVFLHRSLASRTTRTLLCLIGWRRIENEKNARAEA